MVFKDKKQLENFLLHKCRNAIEKSQEKVYEIIDSCLNTFYGEFTPAEYIRTKRLLYSLVKSDVKQVGNGFVAEVYFDSRLLDYPQGMVQLQSGGFGWATWTGEKVLSVAMEGNKPHGGYASGTAVWIKSKEKLGNIYNLLKQKLIEEGIPVR